MENQMKRSLMALGAAGALTPQLPLTPKAVSPRCWPHLHEKSGWQQQFSGN